MKLIDLIHINSIFKPDMEFKNIQVGYKIMKFLKSIENDIVFYNTKLTEFVQECAEKDGDEIKVSENGSITILKDKIPDWNSKIADLENVEVKIELPTFNLEEFSSCNFNLNELRALECLISE